MNLTHVIAAVGIFGADLGHSLVEIDDVCGGMMFACRRCRGEWRAFISDAITDGDVMRKMVSAIGDQPCRGAPLYRRIEGTPWFEYRETR